MNLGLLHSDTLKKITGAVDYNKQFMKKCGNLNYMKPTFVSSPVLLFHLRKTSLSFQFLREKTADFFWEQIYL